jgi:hypothetical protein
MYPVDPKKEKARLIQSAAMSAKNSLRMYQLQFCIEFFALEKSIEMSLGAPAFPTFPTPFHLPPSFTEQGDTRDAASFVV